MDDNNNAQTRRSTTCPSRLGPSQLGIFTLPGEKSWTRPDELKSHTKKQIQGTSCTALHIIVSVSTVRLPSTSWKHIHLTTRMHGACSSACMDGIMVETHPHSKLQAWQERWLDRTLAASGCSAAGDNPLISAKKIRFRVRQRCVHGSVPSGCQDRILDSFVSSRSSSFWELSRICNGRTATARVSFKNDFGIVDEQQSSRLSRFVGRSAVHQGGRISGLGAQLNLGPEPRRRLLVFAWPIHSSQVSAQQNSREHILCFTKHFFFKSQTYQ